jgi:hypothetical protein
VDNIHNGEGNLECHRFENTSVLAANISVILTGNAVSGFDTYEFLVMLVTVSPEFMHREGLRNSHRKGHRKLSRAWVGHVAWCCTG